MKNIKWCHVNVEMFYADVFVFAGSRHDMMKTGPEYVSKIAKEKGWSDDKVDRIGRSLARQLPPPEVDDNGGDVVLIDSACGLICFVRVDGFEPTTQDSVVLSHECLHAALTLIEQLQINEKRNHECLCYLHEFIYKKSLDAMSEPFIKQFQKDHDELLQKNYGVDYYVVCLEDGDLDVTRSKERAKDGRPLTRSDLYKGRHKAAMVAYANECPLVDGVTRPTLEEWEKHIPHAFEVDEFVREKLNCLTKE